MSEPSMLLIKIFPLESDNFMSLQQYGDNFEHNTLSTCCYSMLWRFTMGQEKKPTVEIIHGTKSSPFLDSNKVSCNKQESEEVKQPAEVRDEECGGSHCFQGLINNKKAKLATGKLAEALKFDVTRHYEASLTSLSEKEQPRLKIAEKEKAWKVTLGATKYNDSPSGHIIKAESLSRSAEVIPKVEVSTQTDPVEMILPPGNSDSGTCSSTESYELSSDDQFYDSSSAPVDECKVVYNSMSFSVPSIAKAEYHFLKRLSLFLVILLALITPCQQPAALNSHVFLNCNVSALAANSFTGDSAHDSGKLSPTMKDSDTTLIIQLPSRHHSYNTSLVPPSPTPASMLPMTHPSVAKK